MDYHIKVQHAAAIKTCSVPIESLKISLSLPVSFKIDLLSLLRDTLPKFSSFLSQLLQQADKNRHETTNRNNTFFIFLIVIVMKKYLEGLKALKIFVFKALLAKY
jgi:hypothetical protein